MAQELNAQEVMDMLTVLVERTGRIGELEKKMDIIEKENKMAHEQLHQENTATQVYLETKINPTLQLLLENQTEVFEEKSHITVVESKQEELKDRVDVIEYAVKQNQSDIEELKKRA